MKAILESIESRAGAPDTDRETWLAQRRQGITASNIASLMTGRKSIPQLVRENITGVESFTGNKYTRWGLSREPVLGVYYAGLGITPETRIIRASDNPRYLASPDGIGVDPWDGIVRLAEGKTSKHDLDPEGDAFARSGYMWQMQWQMRVIAPHPDTSVLFAWEQHNDVWEPTPRPFPIQHDWIMYDPDLVARLEAKADEYLAAYDLAVAEGLGDGDPVAEQLGLAYDAARVAAAEAEADRKAFQARLIEHAGDSELSHTSDVVKVTVKPAYQVTETRPDDEAAKAADPLLWTVVEAARADLAELEAEWAEHAKKHTKTVTVDKRASVTITMQNKKK